MITTDGAWSPADRHVYFLAGSIAPEMGELHPFVLAAVNELVQPDGRVKADRVDLLADLAASGARVLIDSGVFWLTNQHKRAHGITMDEALALPPDEIDGFGWLWDGYLEVHRALRDVAWGFIELDQGGAENKRLTRARLNDLGVNPMPVYHPLNDGWDYFDELASSHDRLCMGNIVQAPAPLRLRLLHTLAERHRLYPDLWVHVLGYTANQWVNGIPVDSCDSSSWLSGRRWAGPKDSVMHRRTFEMDYGWRYRYGADPEDLDGYNRASHLEVAMMHYQWRGWLHWDQRLRDELDPPAYPAPMEGEVPCLHRK